MCTFFLFSTQLLVLSTSLCVLAPLPDSFFTRCARTRCVYLRGFVLYFVSFICNEYTRHPAWCVWLHFPSTPSLPPSHPPVRHDPLEMVGKCCCCVGRRLLQSNAMQLHLHTPFLGEQTQVSTEAQSVLPPTACPRTGSSCRVLSVCENEKPHAVWCF